MTTSPPPGKRIWNCPDCGTPVTLSITQLDPLACDSCLAKLKGVGSPVKTDGSSLPSSTSPSVSGPLAIWNGLPDSTRLISVLLLGLAVGFVAGFLFGRMSSPGRVIHETPRPSRSSTSEPVSSDSPADDQPDESTRPGPDYKWIKPYVRKDGVKVKGHWAKDSSRRKS